MAINFTDSIRVGQQKPLEDKYFNGLVPYTSIDQVNNLLPRKIRHIGLTVNIKGEEYWYKDGIENANLVLKVPNLQDITDVIDAISYVEYSSDKINWHSNVRVTDIWMRQKIGKNGVWSEPFLIKGMDALNITVWSENGNVFTNGDISTTLVATVFKGAEDITNSIPSNKFNWKRQSSNPDGDSVWNSLHEAKGKFIKITDDDVSRSAIFLVEIDIPEELLF